ncbi:MAG: hypothetical protein M9937_18015 [Chelatococcus sp.]|nr:hypothetical protein [Chelatococcus sp.]
MPEKQNSATWYPNYPSRTSPAICWEIFEYPAEQMLDDRQTAEFAGCDVGQPHRVSMKRTSLFIAVPAYDRRIYTDTSVAIMDTVMQLRDRKAAASVFFMRGCAIVHHARNMIVSEFLANKDATHLLFVDSDMKFEARTILNMLRCEVPFVAAPYVAKSYRNLPTRTVQPRDLNAFHEAAVNWNVVFEDAGVMTGAIPPKDVRNNFARVKRIGTGLMLLRRDVLETMVRKYQHTEYHAGDSDEFPYAVNRFYDLFSTRIDETGLFIGEDFAFCDRWINECGGEIWCDLTAKVSHMGHHEYTGTLGDYLAIHRGIRKRAETPA